MSDLVWERLAHIDRYRQYLQSEGWLAKRELVLVRDNRVCQACCSATATEVHHKTYDHLYNEPLFDLVAVCRRCHAKIHGRNSDDGEDP